MSTPGRPKCSSPERIARRVGVSTPGRPKCSPPERIARRVVQ